MKSVADWIRGWTPGWTDTERYETLTFWHRLLQPGTIAAFVFGGPVVRFFVLVLHSLVITTQILYRDCLVHRVEREFSNQHLQTLATHFFRATGLNALTRTEKIMFIAGTNTCVLIMFMIILLQESLLWTVAFAAVVFTVPTLLVWWSTVLPPLETDERRRSSVPSPPAGRASSQTPPPASG